MLVCTKCHNEIRLGEIKCSKCGNYIQLGKGLRALYHILTLWVAIIAPGIVFALAFGLAGGGYRDINAKPSMLWMLISLPVCFVLNLITSKALRREEWSERQDIIMVLPSIIYALQTPASVLFLKMDIVSGLMLVYFFAMLLLLQIGMLLIAMRVSKRLKAIRATYDEYYRINKEKDNK